LNSKKVPFVHSNYERIADDDYKTIDNRCVYGLLEYIDPIKYAIADICSPNGSGIVDVLRKCGYLAVGLPDAFSENIGVGWIITNPPYKRPLVDEIIARQIKRIHDEEISGFAVLVRSNFDYAKSRRWMFEDSKYYAQVKLLFRPWWSEDRKAQPIHNYCWHIWMKVTYGIPMVRYSYGNVPN